MESIEDIEALFSSIQSAGQPTNRWYTEPIPSLKDSRVLLSRGPDGAYSLFIRGPLTSFGRLPSLPSLEHKGNAVDAQTGDEFPALRISAPSFAQGNAAVTHIVYEFIRLIGEDPGVDNASLIRRVSWILEILGRNDGPMSPEKQRGLAAECLLLSELLGRGRERGVAPEGVIDKWVLGRRDFAGNGIAIEVKATASATRRHHIGSLSQLEVDSASEKVFIYSVGMRHDPSTNQYLPDYIDAVNSELATSDGEPLSTAREAFEDKLTSYGYDNSHRGLYTSGEGILQRPTLPPRLFRVEDLERLTIASFRNNELPASVVGVSYELEISSQPLSTNDKHEILDSMIGH